MEAATPELYRCKRVKPGDGGIVDGCGWEGEHQAACPSCGSKLLRPLMAEGAKACPDCKRPFPDAAQTVVTDSQCWSASHCLKSQISQALLTEIADDIAKAHYMNAAYKAAELQIRLLRLLSGALKNAPGISQENQLPCARCGSPEHSARACGGRK